MRMTPHRWIGRMKQRLAPMCRAAALAPACLVATSLVACVAGPAYQRPDVPLPAAWRAPLVDAADVTNTTWWQSLADAHLNRYIESALDANLDLRLATLRIEEFDARLQISRGDRYPQVGYGASAKRQRYSEERPVLLPASSEPTQSAFVLGTDISWELDLWGRVQRSNEAARAELLATEEARRTIMLTVVSKVATSYIQLLGLDQQLALVRQTLKNREDALALVDTKYKGGSGTRLQVVQARSVVEELRVVIPELELQIATLENAMSTLLGRHAGPIERGTLSGLALPPVPQGVPSDVLTRRPDVLAAEQALVAANARIGVAKTEYLPTVSLTGMLGLASDDLSWLLARTAKTGEIGAGLVGKIFSFGRIEGNVRQTEAVQKQMVVRYRQAIQTALQEVEDALVFRSKSGEQAAAVGRYVDSLQEEVELSRLRYEGGRSSYDEVLDAERQLYAAQSQQVQRRRDTYLALISVYKAMGGGWMVEQEKRIGAPPQVHAAAAASADLHSPSAIVEEVSK